MAYLSWEQNSAAKDYFGTLETPTFQGKNTRLTIVNTS
jgi:hypothetical protein